MKKVLLTGASGFIGRHAITPLIEKGYEVHALSSQKSEIIIPGVHWYCSDLLDVKNTKELLTQIKPTHVLHFAWYTNPGAYWNSTNNFKWLEASISLIRHFHNIGGKRIVIAGSCAEYDWNYGYCSEFITPCRPTTPYGVCKNALHETLRSFCKEVTLSHAWGRIFYLYGPGENPLRLVASVINSLIKGEKTLCTHGKQIRDFLYIQDVASAFVALLDSSVEGPVNIASGQPVALQKIINMIAEILHASQHVDFGSLSPPPGDPLFLVANNQRLLEEVHWKPHYSLQNGLKETIDWWKSQKGVL